MVIIRTSVSRMAAFGLTGLSWVTTKLLLGQALRARCEGATCPPRAQSHQTRGSTPSRPGSLSESPTLTPFEEAIVQANERITPSEASATGYEDATAPSFALRHSRRRALQE